MTPVYTTATKVEVYVDSTATHTRLDEIIQTWVDITNDVVGDIKGSYGIPGFGPIDRVASTGMLTFTLRNDSGCIGGYAGYYSPGTTNTLAGWTTGCPVRLTFSYSNNDIIKFYGHISKIQPEAGTYGTRRVRITVLDYIDYLARHPITLPTLQYNMKMDEVVREIITMLPIKPLHTQYNSGSDVYPFVFDTVKINTFALSEINKVALSELGYVYVKRDWLDGGGESLVVESRNTRGDTLVLPEIPMSTEDSDTLLYIDLTIPEVADLVQEDGELLALDMMTSLIFDNNMTSMELDFGANLINKVTTKAYPRTVDTNPVVLFTLNRTETIDPGETKVITGQYSDPVLKASKVAGKNMIAPVATTDYQMFSTASGVGNITSSLKFVDSNGNVTGTPIYGATTLEYTFRNDAAVSGWLTKLQARGLAIYSYEPVEFPIENKESEEFHGYVAQNIDMKYQDNLDIAKNAAALILVQNKDPRNIIKSVTFQANYNDTLMRGFLFLDVGDLIRLKETQTQTDAYYYIQSVKFTVQQGGIIEYTFTVTQALTLSETFWILDTSQLDVNTIVGVYF